MLYNLVNWDTKQHTAIIAKKNFKTKQHKEMYGVYSGYPSVTASSSFDLS